LIDVSQNTSVGMGTSHRSGFRNDRPLMAQFGLRKGAPVAFGSIAGKLKKGGYAEPKMMIQQDTFVGPCAAAKAEEPQRCVAVKMVRQCIADGNEVHYRRQPIQNWLQSARSKMNGPAFCGITLRGPKSPSGHELPSECVSATAAVPQIAADLLHRASRRTRPKPLGQPVKISVQRC